MQLLKLAAITSVIHFSYSLWCLEYSAASVFYLEEFRASKS